VAGRNLTGHWSGSIGENPQHVGLAPGLPFLRQSFAASDSGAGKGGGKTLPLAVVLTAALR